MQGSHINKKIMGFISTVSTFCMGFKPKSSHFAKILPLLLNESLVLVTMRSTITLSEKTQALAPAGPQERH
jgi:hypothetical protein